jgi:glutathione S-transferase
MRLYVCYGFLKDVKTTGRPGGHPCGKAHLALKEAGHTPEVIPVHGLGLPPLNRLGKRDEVEKVSGQRWVPVLVTDDGQVINESKEIIAWAKANPAGAAAAPAS